MKLKDNFARMPAIFFRVEQICRSDELPEQVGFRNEELRMQSALRNWMQVCGRAISRRLLRHQSDWPAISAVSGAAPRLKSAIALTPIRTMASIRNGA